MRRCPPRFASVCGDREFGGHAPLADADVAGRNDVALLGLQSPAATHLGYARLPATSPAAEQRTAMVLVDYPDGDDHGFGARTDVEDPQRHACGCATT